MEIPWKGPLAREDGIKLTLANFILANLFKEWISLVGRSCRPQAGHPECGSGVHARIDRDGRSRGQGDAPGR